MIINSPFINRVEPLSKLGSTAFGNSNKNVVVIKFFVLSVNHKDIPTIWNVKEYSLRLLLLPEYQRSSYSMLIWKLWIPENYVSQYLEDIQTMCSWLLLLHLLINIPFFPGISFVLDTSVWINCFYFFSLPWVCFGLDHV